MTTPEVTWHIYMIRFGRDKLYTGVTTDVARRFLEHSCEGAKSAKALRGKGPFELVYSQEIGDKSTALKLECAIKKMSKACKLSFIQTGDISELLQ